MAGSKNEDEKYLVIFQPSGCRGYIQKGKTLKEASVALGVDLEGVCGEKAICGTCKVRIEEGNFEKYGIKSTRENLSPMGTTEKKFFNLRQQQDGYRLACQTHILGNVVIFVPEESRMGKQVVRKAATNRPMRVNPAVRKYCVELLKATLDNNVGDWERLQAELSKNFNLNHLTIDYEVLLDLQNTVREGDWKVTVSVWQGKEVIKIEPGFVEKAYGLAVDVGTSTVAGYLCDLTDGSVVTTASMMNPQVVYGEDVMSRISYTMTNPNGLEILNNAIIDGLNGIVSEVAAAAKIKRTDIVDMTLVGNTCMHHIFLNINPRYIGLSPFPPSHPPYITPLISRSVTGDSRCPRKLRRATKALIPPARWHVLLESMVRTSCISLPRENSVRPLKWSGLPFPLPGFLAVSALIPASLNAKGGR